MIQRMDHDLYFHFMNSVHTTMNKDMWKTMSIQRHCIIRIHIMNIRRFQDVLILMIVVLYLERRPLYWNGSLEIPHQGK